MSRDRASLLDILASVDSILQYVSGLTFEDFEKDVLRQDAVIRRSKSSAKQRSDSQRL